MGWITETPSGRKKAHYRNPEGRIRAKTFDTKAEARRFIRNNETSMDRGDYIDPALGRVTLADFFQDRYLATAIHLAPKTRHTYEFLFRRHTGPRLGRRRLNQLSRLDIEAFLAGLVRDGVSPSTATAAFRVLRAVLSVAERGGLIFKNPAKGVSPPAVPKREMRALTAEEVQRAADAVPPRYRALVLLLAYGGLRIGEAIALRWGSVDLLHRRLTVTEAASEVGSELVFGPTKTGKGRSVSLPRFLVDELAAHLAAFPPVDGLVFTNSDGAPIHQSTFNRRVWTPAVKRAGFEPPLPRVHDLRHTTAALAIASGAHAKEIQARLGHSSITVTLDRYGHLLPGLDERLADRLDEMGRAAAARSPGPSDRVG